MPTEIGSSSAANASGDLVLDIAAMFERLSHEFSIGCLISVPNHLRRLDEQAFTPVLSSIGPVHYSNAKLQTMNKRKIQLCKIFVQRASINLQRLVYRLKLSEREIRSYYAENVVSSISCDDFVTMIMLDGMFILECFLRVAKPDLIGNNPVILDWMLPILKSDLVILDNQLPFLVLEMLFEEANFPAELGVTRDLSKLAYGFFGCYDFQKGLTRVPFGKVENFTDLVRTFYVSGVYLMPLERSPGGDKLSYSATRLHEAGVKLKGVKTDGPRPAIITSESQFRRPRPAIITSESQFRRDLLDMRFVNGVLEIPCIELDDVKVRLIRNIIALEQSHYVGHAFVTDLFVMLDFLIDDSKDVDLLCDKGILINYLGSSNVAASAINSLNTNISSDYMNSQYWEICKNLNAFCKKPWNRWRATLWRQYFSTPWRAASTSAAILLLLLTAIQTVCSLRSTKW